MSTLIMSSCTVKANDLNDNIDPEERSKNSGPSPAASNMRPRTRDHGMHDTTDLE